MTRADSDLLTRTARLVDQVQHVVQKSGNPEGFDAGRWVVQFLEAPHPALGGRRPADLMRTGDGSRSVSRRIAQMQSGAYACGRALADAGPPWHDQLVTSTPPIWTARTAKAVPEHTVRQRPSPHAPPL